MRSIRTFGVALAAVLAMSGVAAAAAQAEGPNWIYGSPAQVLGAGGKLGTTSSVGSFKLVESGTTITCTGETDSGELLGGESGTGMATLSFTGCKDTAGIGEGCVVSTSSSKKGEIGPVLVDTLLAYPDGNGPPSEAAEEEALDAFVAQEGNIIATFKFEEGSFSCALAATIQLEATGTPIYSETESGEPKMKEPPAWKGKRCGVLAEVGKIEGGNFAVAASGETATEGGLNFPSPSITEAEVEEVEGGFHGLTCTLEATLAGKEEHMELVGVTKVEASEQGSPFTAIPFGWEV